MAEMRVDGGVAYTWEDFNEFYRGKYKKKEVAAYWEDCPVKKGKGKKAKGDKPEPKAKAKAKAKAKSASKVRKPRVDEDLLKAALEEATSKPAKTVELIAPFDEGVPGPEHFKITEAAVGEVEEGGFLLQVLYMSADPYQRSRIKTPSGQAGPMTGFVCGRVLASKSPKWFPGDFVGASLPYTTVQVVSEEQLKSPAVWKLTGYVDESTAAQGIGVLGMPGSTAYGGFLDILRPKRAKKSGEPTGEVLFVSAASGAVGQLVGQLAKIVGCTVIGSAGGPTKCAALKEKFGFDHAIDYKTCADAKALEEKLKECSPEGIDMYFENVGGMHFDAAFASLKPGGRVAVCGCISQYNTGGAGHGGLGGELSKIPLGALIYPQIRIEGFMCMRWLSGQKGNFLRDMGRYMRQGKLQITETVTEGIENWGTAFQSLFTGANNGKVAVKVCDATPLRKPKAEKDEKADAPKKGRGAKDEESAGQDSKAPRKPRPLRTPEGGLTAATWNIAAINNNPFEYWITHSDDLYAKLMADFESFIETPGDSDVPIREVFSDALFAELKACMEKEGWEGLDFLEKAWAEDYGKRKIISGFMKDKDIGTKRLASMPDRITNTIGVAEGPAVCRPTVVNNYTESLKSIEEWWPKWRDFMFQDELNVRVKGEVKSKRPCQMLGKITKAKYPAISEEEEKISIPLQTLCQALFDAILVHIMSTLSPDGHWQAIKQSIVKSMFANKVPNSIKVLKGACEGIDVICLQECAADFATTLAGSLDRSYHILVPEDADPSRDQNSLVLLRKARFPEAPAEVTKEALAALDGGAKVASGDLIVVSAKDAAGQEFLVASFHGDTNGLQTNPTVRAVHTLLANRSPECQIVFGLDANVYLKAKEGVTQGVGDFLQQCKSLGLQSCWPEGMAMEECLTTCHARTFVQPQLNKAVKKEQMLVDGDLNPKDHILIRSGRYEVQNCFKDNTGARQFREKTPFPTLHFPSDHAVVSAVLAPSKL